MSQISAGIALFYLGMAVFQLVFDFLWKLSQLLAERKETNV